MRPSPWSRGGETQSWRGELGREGEAAWPLQHSLLWFNTKTRHPSSHATHQVTAPPLPSLPLPASPPPPPRAAARLLPLIFPALARLLLAVEGGQVRIRRWVGRQCRGR